MSDEVERARQEQYRQQMHGQNLGRPEKDDEKAGEVLEQLSKIDDLPAEVAEDEIVGQFFSRLVSTSNLSEADLRSNEWVREYLCILWLCRHPSKEGTHGTDRAWVHDDIDAYAEPVTADKRMRVETAMLSARNAASRSEDAKVIEESTRTVNQSIVSDERSGSGSGGILGKLGL